MGDRAKVSSKEDAELILLQDNLAFDVGHIRRRGSQRGLGAGRIEF